ncbi:MAG: MmcQ/YjbR family DNA-binding protein [Bacteroidia bacterium]
MSLPAATEDVKWGADLCFCVGAKMFCVTGLNEEMKVSLKVTDEEFEEMANSSNIIPAPYMARNKWILIEDADRFTDEEWKKCITQSYEMVKSKLTKKLKTELGLT